MMKGRLIYLGLVLSLLPQAFVSHIHYFENGRPWKQKAGSGPDAEALLAKGFLFGAGFPRG